jgi:transposase
LSQLSSEEKDRLILALLDQVEPLREQVERLARRVAELEARLGEPPKHSGNSSLPPSRDRKPGQPEPKPDSKPGRETGQRREASVGRAGGGRRLHPAPDRHVEARLDACPGCGTALDAAAQKPIAVYDKIELPPVRPVVTRVVLHGGRCPCCDGRFAAPAPAGLEPGSPFGPSVAAAAIYLRYAHAIGYERLVQLFAHLFGLAISEGALANLFRRAKPAFERRVAGLLDELRRAPLIASDETSARVGGRNHWEWVFGTPALAVHVIRPSRARAVPEEVLAGHRPAIWVSDMYGAQRGHADAWQLCLAHQLRDCRFAIEAGDQVLAPRLQALLLRAIAIGRRRDGLKPATLRRHRAALDRQFDRLMALAPSNPHGIRLKRRCGANRDHLLTFLTDPSVPATNNGSERDLRPSVVFRKVTNGFRQPWGADFFAAVRSVLGTARRQAVTPYDAIAQVLADQRRHAAAASPG